MGGSELVAWMIVLALVALLWRMLVQETRRADERNRMLAGAPRRVRRRQYRGAARRAWALMKREEERNG